MLKKNILVIAFFFVVSIVCINFFDAKFAAVNSVKYVREGIIGFAVLMSLPFFFMKSGGLTSYIQVISLSIVVSVYMAHLSWDQGYVDCLKATVPLLPWFIYFLLLKIGIEIETIEKTIVFYGILFMGCFFYQYTHQSTVMFGFKDVLKEDRGITRVVFSGYGFFNLLIFLSLNKVTDNPKNKIFWLVLFTIGIVITIMQVTRQAIVAVFIVCLYHIMRDQSFVRKMIVVMLFGAALFVIVNSDIGFVNKTFNQGNSGSSVTGNIRIKAINYYLSTYSPAVINKVFGNGLPYKGAGYGKFQDILEKKGFYDSDIGLVSFYTFFGLFALIAVVIVYFKSLSFKIPKQYMYLKYYVFFLMFTAFTSDASYNYTCLITNVFVFYCLQSLFLAKKSSTQIRVQVLYNS